MDGGLAARRFAGRISDPQKNPWKDFSGAGTAQGHIAQRIAICLRTSLFYKYIFFECSLRWAQGTEFFFKGVFFLGECSLRWAQGTEFFFKGVFFLGECSLRQAQGTEFFFTGVLFLGNVPFDRPLDAALRVQGTEFFFTSVFLGGDVPFDKLRERICFLPRNVEPWRAG